MSRAQRYFALVVISFMMVVLNMDTNVMGPTLAMIEKTFGIGDAAIGSMMGLFTVIGAVVSLFWGYFSDKASRKALFIVAILIGEIPCTLTAFAPDYSMFFLLRILSGVGLGAAYPLLYSIVGDMFDERERPSAVAIVTVAVSVGTIGGTLVGGYLGGGGDWRTPFIVASAPNYLLVLLYWLLTPEPRKAASEDATRPENRGAVFSIFNLTDSLGQGLGRFVAGTLSGLFGLGAALAICSGFWVFCIILIVAVVFTFMADMARHHERLRRVAEEMKAAAAGISSAVGQSS